MAPGNGLVLGNEGAVWLAYKGIVTQNHHQFPFQKGLIISQSVPTPPTYRPPILAFPLLLKQTIGIDAKLKGGKGLIQKKEWTQ